jgi:hypothetical protein
MPTTDGSFRHSDETREWIAALWKAGHSAREIERLSHGTITRSGVCGLVSRMGLHRDSGRGGAQRPQAPSVKPPKPQAVPKPARAVRVKPAADLPALALDQHDPHRPCQWPYTDAPEGVVCGRTRDSSDWRTLYCREHRALAVRPQKGGVIRLRTRPAPDLSRAAIARPFRFREVVR